MSKVAESGRQEQLGAEILVCAMLQGQTRLARFALEALDGRIVNTKLELGRTPLILAALLPEIKQSVRFVKLLLSWKAAVNCQDAHGRTALSYTCQRGNIDVAKLLVQSSADPEIVDNWGNTALIYGAFAGHSLVVDFLVRSFKRLGLDVARTNLASNSAISIAQDLGHHDCVQILTSQARKQSSIESGTAGPLEDITFKRSPYGQNQASTNTGRKTRGWQLPRVSGARAQQDHNVPRGSQINAGCNGLPESPRPRVNGNCRPHSVSLRREQGAAPSFGKDVKEGLPGGCSGLEPSDTDTENQPLGRKQDSDTTLQGPRAWPPRWLRGQGKTPGCPGCPSQGDVPAVGKQGAKEPFMLQGDRKHVENTTSSSNSLREESGHPVTMRKGMGPLQWNVGSDTAVPSLRLAPLDPDTLCKMAPLPTFPKDLESVLSETCVPGGEMLGKVLSMSDCELEDQPETFPLSPCLLPSTEQTQDPTVPAHNGKVQAQRLLQ
eukprot:g30757.t1